MKANHKEKYIDAGQKKLLFCRPATCVPVNNCKNKRTCQHTWLLDVADEPRDGVGLPAKKSYTV